MKKSYSTKTVLGWRKSMRKCLFSLCLLSLVFVSPTAMAEQANSNDSIQALRDQLKTDNSQEKKQSLLIKMISRGDLQGVQFLVEQGVQLKGQGGQSALFQVVDASRLKLTEQQKYLDIARYLLVKGADVHERDHDGLTVLFHALKNPTPDMASVLIEGGARLDLKDPQGASPVFYAAQFGNTAMLDYLYRQGAKLDLQDQEGNGLLAWVFRAGESRSHNLTYLLGRGVNPEQVNHRGETALFSAVSADKCAFAQKYYGENLFNYSHQNKDGNTVGHMALLHDNYECAKILLPLVEWTEQFLIKNQAGKTPIDLMLEYINGQPQTAKSEQIQAAFRQANLAPLEATFQQAWERYTQNRVVWANMNSIQTIAETYAVDSGGIYPQNLKQMYQAATQAKQAYWQDMLNPFTGQKGLNGALLDYDTSHPGQAYKGTVIYQAISIKGVTSSYRIMGMDHLGRWIQYQGAPLVLSNS